MAQIFALPDTLPAPTVDWANFDRNKMIADEAAHQKALKQYLIEMGYNKPMTGEIYREGVADGYALYMVADGGSQWGLVYLPYGDAYRSLNVSFLTKTEIKERIASDKKMQEFFKKK